MIGLMQTSFGLEIPNVDWAGLSPLLIMAGTPVIFLTMWSLAGRYLPSRTPSLIAAATGVATIVAAAVQWVRVDDTQAQGFTTLADAYVVDGFSLLVTCLIAAAVVMCALYAHDYLVSEDLVSAEFFVLVMLSASGGIVMAGANDLIVLFLGLEVLSIAVYLLAASHSRRFQSQEAGLKYFVLGAFASSFLLYGIALMYGATGTTNLATIRAADPDLVGSGLFFGAMAFLLVGLGFKVASVPFHSWTPDVYDGSPSPVVSFMASAVKVAGFAALMRIFGVALAGFSPEWAPMLLVLACLSMVVGAVVGLVQDNVKRMLAYSSISHAGFILVGVQAATTDGFTASTYYLVAYTFMAVGAFAVVSVVAGRGDSRHSLKDYRGLAGRHPALAFAFTALLLAQAGVPFTTGFLGKLFVIGAAIESSSATDRQGYILAIIAMLAAVAGAFLYLRIVLAMFSGGDPGAEREPVPFSTGLVVAVSVAFTVFFGVFAGPLVDLVVDATPLVSS